MLSKKIIALLCAATLTVSSAAVFAANQNVNSENDVTATASPEVTVDPSASPEATVDPSASPEATVDPSASPEATVDPSASPEVTVDPSASPEATVDPSASPEAAVVPASVSKKNNNYTLSNDTVSAKVSSWFYDEFKDAEFAFELPEAADYTKPATRLEFAQIVSSYLASVDCLEIDADATSDFKDTDDKGVIALNKAGIIEGEEDTQYGAANPLTREATATILARTYKYVNPDEEIEDARYTYMDDSLIADWAVESVYTLYALGIMEGDEDKFDPQANLTLEQALAATVRANITKPEVTAAPSASPEVTAAPSASLEATAAPSASPEATIDPSASPEATVDPSVSPAPSATPAA